MYLYYIYYRKGIIDITKSVPKIQMDKTIAPTIIKNYL